MREAEGGPGGPLTGIGRRRPPESGCSGMQPQAGGKPHPRLNTGERPIANKYREGKMKRTLRRESKALEIAGREALGARRLRARRDVRRRSERVGGQPSARSEARAAAGTGSARAPPDRPRARAHRRPVHPGGTASVGRAGGRGAGLGRAAGATLPLRATSPAAACAAEGEGRPAPFGAGGGRPGGCGRAGAGNPAPV